MDITCFGFEYSKSVLNVHKRPPLQGWHMCTHVILARPSSVFLYFFIFRTVSHTTARALALLSSQLCIYWFCVSFVSSLCLGVLPFEIPLPLGCRNSEWPLPPAAACCLLLLAAAAAAAAVCGCCYSHRPSPHRPLTPHEPRALFSTPPPTTLRDAAHQ